MIAIGHLAGYSVSTIDLLKIFGKTLGDSQFKQCCVIAAAALCTSVGITSWAVGERVLVSSRYVLSMGASTTATWRGLNAFQGRRWQIRSY